MDLWLEETRAFGTPPGEVSTAELAEKIIGMHWPQTVPFGERAAPRGPGRLLGYRRARLRSRHG
jgi:hypothetical protein